jgi:3-hydroxybutyryl-CoA dehydratase
MAVFNKGDKFQKEFQVTENIYDRFIDVYNDRNPLHTDSSFAKEYGFKDKVMHGNILNGFLSYFIGECLPAKNVIIHSQEIQYKNPVYIDQKLILDALINDVFESVNAVEFKFTFKNEDALVVAKGKIQIGILI